MNLVLGLASIFGGCANQHFVFCAIHHPSLITCLLALLTLLLLPLLLLLSSSPLYLSRFKSLWRMYLVRKAFLRRRRQTEVLQSLWRRHQAKKEFERVSRPTPIKKKGSCRTILSAVDNPVVF